MAHFAQINQQNIVTNVIVADQDFINTQEGIWVETFTDGTRKNFAGIGYTYDAVRDAFIPPHAFLSWTLNEETCQWEAPVPRPEGWYTWDEATKQWTKIN